MTDAIAVAAVDDEDSRLHQCKMQTTPRVVSRKHSTVREMKENMPDNDSQLN